MVVEHCSVEFSIYKVTNPITIKCLSTHELDHQTFKVNTTLPLVEFLIEGKNSLDTIVENNVIVKDATIELVSLHVDGIQIDIQLLGDLMWFEPIRDPSQIEYAIKHNITLDQKIFKQTKFYNNGKLCFDFFNFYKKYNKNLLDAINGFNPWVLYSHLGHVSAEDLNELQLIYQNLCNTKKY